MSAAPRGRRAFVVVLAASLGAVAAALVSQHVYDMRPCPWCVLQRLLFVLVAAGAALGLVWRSTAGARVAALMGIVTAGLGAGAALWQHLVAAASASCNLTLADRVISGLRLDALVPDVFAATASCAEAQTRLFGVPYEFWSLASFSGLGIVLMTVLLKQRP